MFDALPEWRRSVCDPWPSATVDYPIAIDEFHERGSLFMAFYGCLWRLADFGTILNQHRILVYLCSFATIFFYNYVFRIQGRLDNLGATSCYSSCMRNKLKPRKTRTKPTRPRVNLAKKPKIPKRSHVSAQPLGHTGSS